MEGYDTDWIEAEDRRFASYTNLPIGSYKFKVQGSNNDGVWNEEGASYKLTILPPWYRTWLAYLIYFLALAIGFREFGKYQARKSLEYADNSRRADELEEAKKIQDNMLPKVFPSSKSYDISAGLVTSTEIGGDYYDFFENNKSLYAVCGDATGHGTSSGMMVSIIKSGLNGLPALTTDKVLYELNNIVKKINLGTLKMSLNICEISNNSITLSSAAMPPIYLYNSRSKKTEEILIRGLPLGGLKNEKFDVEKRKFNKGDVLVLLSDGLPEAENSSGELYDYKRVIKLINENATRSAEEIKNKLIGEVDMWLDGNVPEDDVTFVIIKKI
jgi:serine phosphatase RsbU (regulator of sigma subunit)